eukprot:CAMPEP_0197904404 /NCGR_PEP_ID=MMETSP1439-20131203/58000_1 /TAXON_ID=66791 /ORGANISM="Gonyaulax spinifera, Strain CCMP409" /LENGTH=55 /DNA_ID=CAMNT_0043525593 /DNA_START=23 /DNA_END=190 /DNA_ORIENTATION=+
MAVKQQHWPQQHWSAADRPQPRKTSLKRRKMGGKSNTLFRGRAIGGPPARGTVSF